MNETGPVVRQKTLKTAIGCSGIGLHAGTRVHMTLHPAAPGHGIEFRRNDIRDPEAARVRARWDQVIDTRLCTVIGNEAGTRVATIEHLMAALYGCEIDNAIVEIDGPEVPVMDGSASPFVFLIECAGVVEQPAPRQAIEVLRRVAVEDGDSAVSITPANGLSIDFEIDYTGTAIERQDCYVPFGPGVFKSEVSRARTFGFLHEVEQLRAAGLALGGSLDNAVVVSGDRILNEDGLRYDDEFVRHKVLDCVGDLYLAGAPVLGHVAGSRSGHNLNNRMLRTLFAREGAWRVVDMTEAHRSPARRRATRSHPHLRVAAGD